MKFRILQHKKHTDTICISGVNNLPKATIEDIITRVIDSYQGLNGILPEEFGRHWTRISIVEPDTLAVIADIYNQN